MSSIRLFAPGVIRGTLVLVLGGCGESPVYTRGAPDAGAVPDGPRLGERGPSPAGSGGAGSVSVGPGIGGAPGDGTQRDGSGGFSGTDGAYAGSGGGVAAPDGQNGAAAAGQGGNPGVVGPGGVDGITPGSEMLGTGGREGSSGVTGTGGAPLGTGGSSSAGGTGGGSSCGGVEPVRPAEGIVSDFATITTSGDNWTASNGVSGRTFAYYGGTPSTATVQLGAIAHDLHCTANLGDGSKAGCGVVVDGCLAADPSAALQFSMSGISTCQVVLQIQTYSQKPTTDAPPGGCRGTCGNYSSSASLILGRTPVTVALSTLTHWTAASAAEIVGVQWQITNPPGKTSCIADLHFDDIAFVP